MNDITKNETIINSIFSKYFILVGFLFSSLFFAQNIQNTQNIDPIPYPNLRNQNNTQPQTPTFKKTVFANGFSIHGSKENQALYIINEKVVNSEEFRKIDPNTIKSISVLKDKAATALYGEKGINGVILITLKDD